MPAWLIAVGAILGLVEEDWPAIEAMLNGFATFIAAASAQIWGSGAASQINNSVQAAERIVSIVTADAGQALDFAEQMWPSFADLEKGYPGTMQALMAKHVLMRDVPNMTHAMATKFVEIGVANQRAKTK
jgi:hypothetical protein